MIEEKAVSAFTDRISLEQSISRVNKIKSAVNES